MKNESNRRAWVVFCVGFLVWSACANAQNIFVKLSSSRTATNSINVINPPPGNSFSAAAPFSGNFWNVVTQSNNCPPGTIAPFDTNLYVNLPLVDSSNNLLAATMTVSYHLGTSTGSRNEPSTANGENTLQPGGVMQNAWRNFSTGNYATFTITNLTASGLYGLFIYGGTTTTGQGCQATNISGQAAIVWTTNNLANSAGTFGAIWTISGGATNLMPQGKTWNFTTCQADANGVFSFRYGVPSDGNFRYYNGFQLVPLSAPGVTGPTNQTIIAGNDATLSASATGFPTPNLQWLENGTNVVGATNASLVLPGVQYTQNNFTYSLLASNAAGTVTNTMTLTVIVTPSITGLTNQAVAVSNDVTIAASVTGVPTPSLQWQFNNSNVIDGAQPDGSTNSGSTTATLTISNAQTNETGTFCLIASNSAGVATNCMTLTVSGGDVPPVITGLTDQSVVQGDNGTFNASVSGLPTPMQQWYDNGGLIPGATGVNLILTNVQYLTQDGHVYSIIASNAAGTATNSATLHVFVPVSISVHPQSLVVTNTQGAAFSVTASGVPAPAYQWYFNTNPISNATNSTYSITSATASNIGTYYVVVSNVVNSVTSSNATLTVNSTMAVVSLTPSNSATGICYDTPLYITFDRPPLLRNSGLVRIYNVTNPASPVDTLDMSQNVTLNIPFAVNVQNRTIAGETYATFPVIITGNTAAIYPHLDLLTSNQTYFVTVDDGVFTDTNAAYFAGITATNTWVFATKPTGPANPTNIVVSTDGSGDFLTVQGAIDYVPNNNTTPRLINIRNGTYTEVIDIKSKNNLIFRGQDRSGTVIAYANNGNMNPSTHFENVFKVSGNDIVVDTLTLNDTSGFGASPAQALMLESNIKRFILNNAEVDGFQDTMLGNTSGTQAYFNHSLIQGSTDFIWGGMNGFFDSCEIKCRLNGSHITQSRTDPGSNGISFVNCQLTRSSNTVTSCDLGRSINIPSSSVAYVYCKIDAHITGWSAEVTNSSLGLRWWEYSNSNLTATVQTNFNGIILTNGDSRVTLASVATNWLNGWAPQLAPNILTNPVSVTVTAGVNATFSVAATGIPDPTYQWQLGGSNLVGQTSSTLTVSNAHCADAGTYSVIVSNIAGTVISSNATLTVIGTAPVASFTASPASGTEPVTVTFTDTSTGSPLSLAWDFGDFTTTNTAAGAVIIHTYAAGAYTVTLTASNACDMSTLVSNNVVSVVTAFQAWQLEYFGCTNCPQAAAGASPSGNGVNNGNEFAAGFNPNNVSAYAHIISIATQGSDMNVTYLGADGDSNYSGGPASRTNVLEFSTGAADGSYSNNFVSTGQTNILSGGTGVGVVTNMVDTGGATGAARYYRIRVLAP